MLCRILELVKRHAKHVRLLPLARGVAGHAAHYLRQQHYAKAEQICHQRAVSTFRACLVYSCKKLKAVVVMLVRYFIYVCEQQG